MILSPTCQIYLFEAPLRIVIDQQALLLCLLIKIVQKNNTYVCTWVVCVCVFLCVLLNGWLYGYSQASEGDDDKEEEEEETGNDSQEDYSGAPH